MTGSAGKPNAPSCERNRDPILAVLHTVLSDRHRILEIGSGTGQHAVYFAEALSHLEWQTSDRAENLPGIDLWLVDAGLENMPAPLELDVGQAVWPEQRFDAVFTANTLHIMAWSEVAMMFARLPDIMTANAILIVYGPFNIGGRYTSESNAGFDRWLKEQGEHMGIRDLAEVDALAESVGLRRIADHELPANNRCVVWQRQPGHPGAANLSAN